MQLHDRAMSGVLHLYGTSTYVAMSGSSTASNTSQDSSTIFILLMEQHVFGLSMLTTFSVPAILLRKIIKMSSTTTQKAIGQTGMCDTAE